MDRRFTHKKGQKGLALEQPYANFIKSLHKSLERQYKELYNDISYIDTAQSVHITFTYYSFTLFLWCVLFFVRLTSPYILRPNSIGPVLCICMCFGVLISGHTSYLGFSSFLRSTFVIGTDIARTRASATSAIERKSLRATMARSH